MAAIIRQNPHPSYASYKKYKPHLRIDFSYSCAYCTIHEAEWGGLRHFHIEHFRPKCDFPELETDYGNLMYSCDVCNCYKGKDWPADDPLAEGVGYLDPCHHDYEDHFECDHDTGEIGALSPPADYMIERLHLARPFMQRLRRRRAEEEEIHRKLESLRGVALTRLGCSEAEQDPSSEEVDTMQLAAQLIDALWENELRRWENRWKPPYEPEDLR